MDIKQTKALAEKVQSNVAELLSEFTGVLEKRGFKGIEVISFSIGNHNDRMKLTSFVGSPCPTICRVLEDGRVECRPEC